MKELCDYTIVDKPFLKCGLERNHDGECQDATLTAAENLLKVSQRGKLHITVLLDFNGTVTLVPNSAKGPEENFPSEPLCIWWGMT